MPRLDIILMRGGHVESELAGQVRVEEKKRGNTTDYFLIPLRHIRVDGDMRVAGQVRVDAKRRDNTTDYF